MSQFPAEPYRSDGGFSLGGLLVLIAALAGAAVGLGWLASFSGQWFYFIIMVPLLISLGLILVGAFVGKWAKLRNRGLAILLGLASGALAMTAVHYFDYLRFQPVQERLAKEFGPNESPGDKRPDPRVNKAIELLRQGRGKIDVEWQENLAMLKKACAADTLAAYLDFEATRGLTISNRRGHVGYKLSYAWTWIYWVAELLVVPMLAALGLANAAAAPFCRACNQWKKVRVLGTLQSKGANVAALLRDGNIRALAQHEPAPAGGDLVLSAAVCPRCAGFAPIAVKLEEVTKTKKGRDVKTKLAHLSFPGDALPSFEAIFQTKPTAATDDV